MGLLEPSAAAVDEGALVGRDPRALTPADFAEAGVPLMPVLRAVRAKCIDCSAGNAAEVRKCVTIRCPLWPIRMGRFPAHLRKGLRADEDQAEEGAPSC